MNRFDSATRARFRLLYPDVATRAIRLYNDVETRVGVKMRCTEAIRTLEYQGKLYAQGRTTPGKIITYSRPGFSLHHFGCALDSCFVGADPWAEKTPDVWKDFGRIAKAYGFEWGGSWSKFVDRPHIQLTYGLPVAEIRALFAQGGLPAVWAKFDQVRGVPQGEKWDSPYTKTRLFEIGELAGV